MRVLFSLAHRPKDPGPNSCVLVDWAWFTAAKYGLITNQVVRKSYKSPQGKNAIPPKWSRQNVRVLFSLAHKPKDPGPNSCILVDWAWSTAAKYGLITNQVVRKSHKSPQGKNAIPPKQ